MAHLVTRIAPVLLASLVVTLATVSTHAETSAAPDCLAKPNGPAAKGSHWYYRIAHPSGRHCWYQRSIDAAKSAPALAQPAAAVAAPAQPAAPASRPASQAASPPASDTSTVAPAADADDGQSVVPPISAPAATTWPAVAAPPAVQPATPPSEPKIAEPQPTALTAPPHIPVRTLKVERPAEKIERAAEAAEPTNHVPALLGAAFALVIIVLGLLAMRVVPKLLRRPAAVPLRDLRTSIIPMEDAPGIVPAMPGRGEGERRIRTPRLPREDMSARWPDEPRLAEPTPSRETARELEENVRELLRRLQADLRARPDDTPPPATHAPSTQELDAVLAMWRAKRR